jgi:hypothetical protein
MNIKRLVFVILLITSVSAIPAGASVDGTPFQGAPPQILAIPGQHCVPPTFSCQNHDCTKVTGGETQMNLCQPAEYTTAACHPYWLRCSDELVDVGPCQGLFQVADIV